MKLKKLVIFGATQLGEVAWYYFTNDSAYTVAAFCVDTAYYQAEKTTLQQCPIITSDALASHYPPEDYDLYVAIGDNVQRAQKYNQFKALGYTMANYISSQALVANNVTMGDNVFIFELNNIQPFVHIGNNVVLWSGNHVGHHSQIHDHNFISSHVVVAGGVTIEAYCFLGINSSIRDHITIAAHNIVGAGALITKSTQPYTTHFGPRGISKSNNTD